MAFESWLNTVKCGDCVELMKKMPDDCVDLVLTSPPYDHIRAYESGHSFDFKGVARELYRVLKSGGTAVWVVGDQTVDGSETGTSFRQVLRFMATGFKLNDTMIYRKPAPPRNALNSRYEQEFEFMFVLSKGAPKTFHPIEKLCKYGGRTLRRKYRDNHREDLQESSNVVARTYKLGNIWSYATKVNDTGHPAVFPLGLARDHIKSWTDPGDVVLDPFGGSGTTGLACQQLGRKYILFDISEKYCKIAQARLERRKDAYWWWEK